MGLQIVKYDPNDYKLGDALALNAGDKLENESKISQVLSLYFQWKQDSTCWAYTSKDKTSRSQVLVSYDEEERVATQLFVEFSDTFNKSNAEWVFLRLEIFENCFEFESQSLDWFQENGKTIAIIEIPKSVSVVKNRRFPRIQVNSDTTVSWRSANTHKQVKLKSLSLTSLIVEGSIPVDSIGLIEAGNTQFPAKVIREFDGMSSIVLSLADNLLIGTWFDYYRFHAYPELRKRSDLNPDDCLKLYSDSGYFSKYRADTIEAALNEIKKAWQELEQLEHLSTADYAVINNNLPVGIGSSSFTYTQGEKEFWTFHSLCTLKNYENLDLTKTLYSWRAEYNFARIENMDTLLFFASQSRWIERIYINFILRKQQSGVEPIRLYTITYQPKNHNLEVQKKQLSTEHSRVMITKPGLAAAALPDLVHVRGKLNCIVLTDSTIEHDDITKFGEQLAFEVQSPITFRVSVPATYYWNPALEQDLPTDRLGILRKEDLMDFIASLSHSIEVTKRKKSIA